MKPFTRLCSLALFGALLAMTLRPTMADGTRIDRLYHPYVQPLEHEFELRYTREQDANTLQGDRDIARLGYGQSLNDVFSLEAYLVGDKSKARDFKVRTIELEGLWQLSEQGEYFVDAGLLFDVESRFDNEQTELSSALLLEREWGRWSGTANIYGIYEFGDTVNDEFESALNLQVRYRYSMRLEPAIEFYKAQRTFGLGPTLLGRVGLGHARKLRWEAGLVFGLDHHTPDQTLRTRLEYEF